MPRWSELKRFCERDGWTLYKNTDHDYYRKIDGDGTVRQAKVSRGGEEIHHHLWRQILNRQLCVSQEYFNSMI